ncbi:PD-(D/E)XK nuclease family protein (plasmid) [Arcobacter cryaerophilus gv. pseudocryaerophilus]|uniref:PD-(D/E)XK nuclease family protein n=3 Tax=Arcobacteraceae TaxID=2808963 RepID=A0AA96DX49_9BACT|nr:PD-(D/E)XK nuclease family protein [Arcobacter sp. AZ-2023]WNL37330.1 PD-(D/E)XK nuclease family protein [Arcobacter sp. AZ-2023]WPD13045.1 PD-(D/E)XK nuclease family protein [Arcobacter sp. DSM 115960]
MLDKEYIEFFETVKRFLEKQQKQRERGLNDYNLLTTVLNEHDEVRLHSRVIGSLLDVNGLHYQKELFLELFLEILDVNEFQFNFHESKIFLEYQNIDLYLTDGKKHIIIENKIYAEDQENQIKRYYEIIKSCNKQLQYNDILVVYLSIDRSQPSSYSLENLIIKDNYLINNDEKVAIFKNINYKNEILNWLDKCLYEIQNITNLNESVQQYKNIVEKITNKYKGKVMSLKELLKNEKYYKLAKEISVAFQENNKIIKEEYFKNCILDIVEKKSIIFENHYPANTAVDILSNYIIRFVAQDTLCLVQISDINGYKSKCLPKVDNKKKQDVFKKLKEINNNFRLGSYPTVYADMQIDYKEINYEKLNELIDKLINLE